MPVARLILQNLKKNLLDAASTGIVNLVLWVTQQALRLNKSMSTWQVKEVLKSAKYTWRRVRKSMKKQRDECLFEFFKQEIVELCVLDKKNLFVFGFTVRVALISILMHFMLGYHLTKKPKISVYPPKEATY